MNMGIQDAVNLAWKLALVVQGRAPQRLLDTYSEERLPVARAVLGATHLNTIIGLLRHPLARALRRVAYSLIFKLPIVNRAFVNTGAGLRISYRERSLARRAASRSGRSRLRPGDRAPDVLLTKRAGAGSRIYHHLCRPEHTLLAFAGVRNGPWGIQRAAAIVERLATRSNGLVQGVVVVPRDTAPPDNMMAPIVEDGENAAHDRYGLRDGGLCLIRPDRYIAVYERALEAEALERYLATAFTVAGSGSPRQSAR